MPTRGDRQNNRLRQEVAVEAARILATEGQRNYLNAKQKAAHRLGLSGRASMPSNSEVENELKRYQALYCGEEHASGLKEMRRAALEAMKFFGRFRPKLAGPVLEGTADRHSRISLHVFCETPDEVAEFLLSRPKLAGPVLEGTADRHSRISLHVFCETPDEVAEFLLSRNIRFDQETRRIRWHDDSYRDLELIVIEADGQCFELGMMAGNAWKQPPPDPIDGGAQRRAGTSEVERLIAEPGF